MQKINFQDLPSTTTPLNSTNLNQLQTNVENEVEHLMDKLVYSDTNTEVKIGWIIRNGVKKSFYRKKYESSVLTSGEEIIDYVGDKEIEMIEGWLFNDSGFVQPYGCYQTDTARTSRVFTDGTSIKVQQGTGWQNNNIKARVIIYYSKSTDTE